LSKNTSEPADVFSVLHTITLTLSIKQWGCEYQLFKSFGHDSMNQTFRHGWLCAGVYMSTLLGARTSYLFTEPIFYFFVHMQF